MSDNVFVPTIMNIRLTKTLSAGRYWEFFRAVQTGWLLVENKSTSNSIRVHFNESGNADSNYKTVKPLHSKPFQIGVGDVMWMSSTLNNNCVKIENSKYKPNVDEYLILGDSAVRNVPFYADGVAITTTYNCTTLNSGYATQFQVGSEANFTGTLEYSSDGGATFSSAITLNHADTLRQAFTEIDRVVTTIRITVVAGTFFIFYR